MTARGVNRVVRYLLFATLLGPLLLACGAGSNAGALSEIARERVAARTGLSSQGLLLLRSSSVSYPLQGIAATRFRLAPHDLSSIYDVTLAGDGQELDAQQLERREQSLYQERYGRIDPALHNHLRHQTSDVPIEVNLWLNLPARAELRRPDPRLALSEAEHERDLELARQRLAQVTAAGTQPVLAKLAQRGYSFSSDPYVPILFGQLAPAAIAEVAQWPEIDRIYLAPTEPAQSDSDNARGTLNTDIVTGPAPLGRGITGRDVRVAQVDAGGRVARANTWLKGVTQDTTSVCATASAHSTAVAGIIRSTHPTYRGIAPDALLWAGGSCNSVVSELQNRSSAAVTWGARVLNLSWSAGDDLAPNAVDRFYDDMVVNSYVTVIKSAGNRGGCLGPVSCGENEGSDGRITSPGKGYNVITVGNLNDFNTLNWTDDTIASSSSWRNPSSTHNDRVKPELVAPGTGIATTSTQSPWVGPEVSGSSYAAPMVAGTAALLIQRDWWLRSWPEGVKAILMASALPKLSVPMSPDVIDEYYGAGQLHVARADDIANKPVATAGWEPLLHTCSDPSNVALASISLTAGKRTRVALAWPVDPAYANYPNQPAADLNLYVTGPLGIIAAQSSSFDNNVELVDFVPSISATYTVRLVRARCDASPYYLGLAWRQQPTLKVVPTAPTVCPNQRVQFKPIDPPEHGSITWTSDGTPAQATGAVFSASFTVTGTHVITATWTDGSITERVTTTVRVNESSGAFWHSRFMHSINTNDLVQPFRARAQAFIAALQAAGANVIISTTYRPPERAYLMHYSPSVGNGTVDARDVPSKPGVNICWVHYDANGNYNATASRAGASALAQTYGIAYPASLNTRHGVRNAVDMTITWTGNLTILNANGTPVTITTTPRNGSGNQQLWAVGATYNVYKLAADPPHWSDNGN